MFINLFIYLLICLYNVILALIIEKASLNISDLLFMLRFRLRLSLGLKIKD